MKGIVEFFNNVKGLGFVAAGDQRYFVHESDILMSGFRTLLPGWEVEFEIQRSQKGLACRDVLPPEGLAGLKKGQKEGNPRLEDGIVKMVVDNDFKPSFPEVQKKTTRYMAAATFTAYYTGEVVVGKILELEMSLPAQSPPARVTLLLDPEKNPRRIQEDGQYKHVANGSYVLVVSKTGQVGVWCVGRQYQRFNTENGENWLVVEQRFMGQVIPNANPDLIRKQLPTSGLKRNNDGFAKGIARAFELLL